MGSPVSEIETLTIRGGAEERGAGHPGDCSALKGAFCMRGGFVMDLFYGLGASR